MKKRMRKRLFISWLYFSSGVILTKTSVKYLKRIRSVHAIMWKYSTHLGFTVGSVLIFLRWLKIRMLWLASAPLVACFMDVERSEYCLSIENKIVLDGIPSFSKSMALWFSSHYIFNLEYNDLLSKLALFFQEFVFGLPASRAKKTSTYLTVTSDVQTFTIA